MDGNPFSELQKNPNLLHSLFANISEICAGDPDKEVKFMGYECEFVATCRKKLFEDTINHISGISLTHVRSKGSDLMSRYPNADYMRSELLSQVVLNNGYALKGKNFVSDEAISLDEELQISYTLKTSTMTLTGTQKEAAKNLSVVRSSSVVWLAIVCFKLHTRKRS